MASHSRVVGKRQEKNAATVIPDTTETWHEEKKRSTSHSCEGALLLASRWIFYSAKVLRFCHISPQPLLVQQTHPSLSVSLPSQPSRDPHQGKRDPPRALAALRWQAQAYKAGWLCSYLAPQEVKTHVN